MKKNLLKYIVLVISISFMVVGTSRGEVKTVLKKATNICLECIGIG